MSGSVSGFECGTPSITPNVPNVPPMHSDLQPHLQSQSNYEARELQSFRVAWYLSPVGLGLLLTCSGQPVHVVTKERKGEATAWKREPTHPHANPSCTPAVDTNANVPVAVTVSMNANYSLDMFCCGKKKKKKHRWDLDDCGWLGSQGKVRC